MPFKRSQVASLQRVDAVDFNRTNDSAWANIVQLARDVLGLSPRVVWGFEPTLPGGMTIQFSPGGAVAPGGPVYFSSTQSVVLNTGSAQPRIDLISVGYSEAPGSNEARTFWDSSANNSYVANVNTEIISNPQLTVTQGTPSANPVPPATPSGHVPIAYVRVEANQTSIDPANVSRPPEAVSGLVVSVPKIAIPTNGLLYDLAALSPWTSDDTPSNNLGMNLSHKLPVGKRALIVGSVRVQSDVAAEQGAVVLGIQRTQPTPQAVVAKAVSVVPRIASGIGNGIDGPGVSYGTSVQVSAVVAGTGAQQTYRLVMGHCVADIGSAGVWGNVIRLYDCVLWMLIP